MSRTLVTVFDTYVVHISCNTNINRVVNIKGKQHFSSFIYLILIWIWIDIIQYTGIFKCHKHMCTSYYLPQISSALLCTHLNQFVQLAVLLLTILYYSTTWKKKTAKRMFNPNSYITYIKLNNLIFCTLSERKHTFFFFLIHICLVEQFFYHRLITLGY